MTTEALQTLLKKYGERYNIRINFTNCRGFIETLACLVNVSDDGIVEIRRNVCRKLDNVDCYMVSDIDGVNFGERNSMHVAKQK